MLTCIFPLNITPRLESHWDVARCHKSDFCHITFILARIEEESYHLHMHDIVKGNLQLLLIWFNNCWSKLFKDLYIKLTCRYICFCVVYWILFQYWETHLCDLEVDIRQTLTLIRFTFKKTKTTITKRKNICYST